MTIPAIVTLCQGVNPEIGNYVNHIPGDVFVYSVQVDNGRLRVPIEAEQDAELSTERVRAIAGTFVPK